MKDPGRSRGHEQVAILSVLLILMWLLPARLVIPQLGAAGRPAVLFSFGLGLLWMLSLLRRGGLPGGRQPVRYLICLYLLVQLVTYVVGFERGLSVAEANSADRWLIFSMAMAGLAVFVADGLGDRAQLDTLLRRFTWGAGASAAVGAIQFLVDIDLTQYIKIPGLEANIPLIGIGDRGAGFPRVAGTMSHYIEFGVVLSMALPIAIHYAFFAVGRPQQLRRWLLVMLIASAVPFSISRSGVLAVAVAFVVLFSVWPWRLRYNALFIGLIAASAYWAVQPGLFGTIGELFTGAFGDDPSVQGRTQDYAVALDYISQRPWWGRGAGTFIPEQYILLDNQFLGTVISSGFVGLAVLLLLFLGGYWTLRSVRHRSLDQQTRHMAQALAASMLVGLVSSATFDSLSFTGFACVLFLILGCGGALWRLDRTGSHRALQSAAPGDRLVASAWMAPDSNKARP